VRGLLADKTVVLVTHHPHFMHDGTSVIVLGKGGTPIASGTWDDVQMHINQLAAPATDGADGSTVGTTDTRASAPSASTTTVEPSPSATQEVMAVNQGGGSPSSVSKTTAVSRTGDGAAPSVSKSTAVDAHEHKIDERDGAKLRRGTALVLPEDRVMGVVTLSTYLAYMGAGGTLQACTVIALFLCAQGLLISVDYQLESWASASPPDQKDDTFVRLYGILVGVTAAATLVRSVLYYSTTLKAASNLHDGALSRVLRAPMAFFTANPLGRIVNRFSSDQGQADTLLPDSLFETLNLAGVAGGSLIFACIAIPYVPPIVLACRIEWRALWRALTDCAVLF
jgi:ATP-binding cassette subfamily C (CFTR/MRP) protein 4